MRKTLLKILLQLFGEVVFTVNVTNNGPSNATGVKITDVVPAGFEFVESSDKGYDSATGLLTVPLIKAGESYVFTITLKAVTNGTLTNVVNVTSNENSTAKGDNVSVKVIPVVDLTVVKSVVRLSLLLMLLIMVRLMLLVLKLLMLFLLDLSLLNLMLLVMTVLLVC